MRRIQVTEYLDLDLDEETWICNRCEQPLVSARKSYKEGCLVYNRDPREIHKPLIDGPYTLSPDPEWIRILEFFIVPAAEPKSKPSICRRGTPLLTTLRSI